MMYSYIFMAPSINQRGLSRTGKCICLFVFHQRIADRSVHNLCHFPRCFEDILKLVCSDEPGFKSVVLGRAGWMKVPGNEQK